MIFLPKWARKQADKERSHQQLIAEEKRKELERKAEKLIEYLMAENIKIGEFEIISKIVIETLGRIYIEKGIKEIYEKMDSKSDKE